MGMGLGVVDGDGGWRQCFEKGHDRSFGFDLLQKRYRKPETGHPTGIQGICILLVREVGNRVKIIIIVRESGRRRRRKPSI